MDREAGPIASRSTPEKSVAQTTPVFALDFHRRRQCQRGTARSACRKVLTTGAARSACHRPAAASLAYQPDSRHRRQSLPNEARLAEFVRLLPQAPAAPCKAAFDFHPAKLSQAPIFPADGKFPKGVVTPPFLLKSENLNMPSNPFKTGMLKALAAFLGDLQTYCAVKPKVRGAL